MEDQAARMASTPRGQPRETPSLFTPPPAPDEDDVLTWIDLKKQVVKHIADCGRAAAGDAEVPVKTTLIIWREDAEGQIGGWKPDFKIGSKACDNIVKEIKTLSTHNISPTEYRICHDDAHRNTNMELKVQIEGEHSLMIQGNVFLLMGFIMRLRVCGLLFMARAHFNDLGIRIERQRKWNLSDETQSTLFEIEKMLAQLAGTGGGVIKLKRLDNGPTLHASANGERL